MNTVEINLKMITTGQIDDIKPHFATAKFNKITYEDQMQVCWFKFVDFKKNSFDNLINALLFLDSKEKTSSTPLPTHPDTIKNVDDAIAFIIDKTRQGQFILPVLPKIVHEINQLMKNPDTTIDDLTTTIEKDAAIALKVIATANSPFYRTEEKITSIRETIPRLGFKEAQTVILTIANKSFYRAKNKYYKELLQTLWNHSLSTANCAKAIAETKSFDNADEFYTAGLIHDIGKTVLFRFLGEMGIDNTRFPEADIIRATEAYNAEMCEIVLRHWEFPESFIKQLSTKEMNNGFQPENRVKYVLDISNTLSVYMGYDIIKRQPEIAKIKSAMQLGLNPVELYEIIEKVRLMMEDSESAF